MRASRSSTARFAGPRDGDRSQIGRPVGHRVRVLRGLTLLPLRKLLGPNHQDLFRDPWRTAVFYSQSWAFVHYLMLGDNGAHRAQLKAYLAGAELRRRRWTRDLRERSGRRSSRSTANWPRTSSDSAGRSLKCKSTRVETAARRPRAAPRNRGAQPAGAPACHTVRWTRPMCCWTGRRPSTARIPPRGSRGRDR